MKLLTEEPYEPLWLHPMQSGHRIIAIAAAGPHVTFGLEGPALKEAALSQF